MGKVKKVAKAKTEEKDRFEVVAKRLGCDEDKARFERALGKIARAPATAPKPRKARKS